MATGHHNQVWLYNHILNYFTDTFKTEKRLRNLEEDARRDVIIPKFDELVALLKEIAATETSAATVVNTLEACSRPPTIVTKSEEEEEDGMFDDDLSVLREFIRGNVV